MGIRNLGGKLLFGGGALTGLLMGWTAIDSLCTQNTIAQERRFAPGPDDQRAQRNYLNKNVIRLPIEINPAQRALIQEIQLYMKESANAPWVRVDKVDGSRDAFTFQAPKDGEYWFTMVTIDRQGRSAPANVQKEPPGLVVIIDTQKPTVQVANMGATPEGQLIRLDARDANLDLGKTQVYFQGGDNVFRPTVPVAAGVFRVPAECKWTGLVRAVVEDLAGNRVEHEEHVSQLVAAKAPETKPQTEVKAPLVAPSPLTLPKDIQYVPALPNNDPRPVERPMVPTTVPTTPQALPKTPGRPDGTDGPRFEGNLQRTDYRAPAKRQLVNTHKLFLDYQVENAGSGAGKVDVWITRDMGKTWQKLAEDNQRKSPVEVYLPGEGLFGITLVATSSYGVAGAPPASGDVPDGWIEVDTTRPNAQFTRIESVPDGGLHCVHIHWSVKDANLGDAPVELQYAVSPQGPWQTIAKGLKAQGEHRWTPSKEVGTQAHLRLIAQDLAGNQAFAGALEPVQIGEPARPRVILRGISTGVPAVPTTAPTPVTTSPAPLPQIPTPSLPQLVPTPPR